MFPLDFKFHFFDCFWKAFRELFVWLKIRLYDKRTSLKYSYASSMSGLVESLGAAPDSWKILR
jgi:hypothetical protein